MVRVRIDGPVDEYDVRLFRRQQFVELLIAQLVDFGGRVANRLCVHVDCRVMSLLALPERDAVPSGNVSGARNRRHLTRLSEWKWIRQAKAVESLVFRTRI